MKQHLALYQVPLLYTEVKAMQKKLLLISCFVMIAVCVNAQVIINNAITAQQMAQALVGNGIQISNVTLTAPIGSYGYFNRNGSSIRLDSGIVLTTGQVKTNGFFVTGLDGDAIEEASEDNNAPGDSDLETLVTGQTSDACILEFDFVPTGDSINFRYIFSSEEYPEYNCTEFNDVFAFFISGPGIIGQRNLALIPGTNIPVSINSVNNGIPGTGGDIADCNAMGPGSPFPSLYVDNSTSHTITHNGFTIIFTARAAVQPCATYHIKLAIADVSDGTLDSGVFLEAGSFNSSSPKLVPQFATDINGNPYMAEGCNPGSFKVVLPSARPIGTLLNLQYTGVAVRGTDYNAAPLTITIPAGQLEATINLNTIVDNLPEGNELAKIYLLSSCSSASPFDSLTFEVRDYDTLNLQPRYVGYCPTGSINSVQLQVNGFYTSYSWTPAATLNNATIANPIASPTGITTYIVTTQLGTCNGRDSVLVNPKRISQLTKKNNFCAGGNDGYIHLNGNQFLTYPLSFSINNGPFGPDSNFNNLGVGTYTVSILDGAGCRLDSIVSITQAFPPLSAGTSTTFANCNGSNGSITVTAAGGAGPYVYSLDGIGYQLANSFGGVMAGPYTVYIRDSNNCVITVPVTVNGDPPVNISAVATPASCSGNADGSITVTATGGSGTYSYILANSSLPPQTSNVLPATSGHQLIIVMDNTGCIDTLTQFVPLNNTATVDARTDTTICQGQSVTLTTISNGTSFNWQPVATLSNTSAISPVATPPGTTEYFVTATLGICTRTDSVTVTVLPAPIPNAGPDTAVCFGAQARLHASGGVSYLWNPAQTLSANNIFNPLASPPATTVYTVLVRDANGCNSLRADSVTVTIFPGIDAYAGRDTVVAINQPLQLQATGSTNYIWTPTTGLSNPNIANPIAVLQNDITYLVTVSDAIGCKDTASIRIKVYLGPEIYVPNAFSPNGDGKNDVLRAIVIGFKSFDYFTVFNRWGQRIFTTSDYRRGWDGTYNGLLQNQGNYVWVARGTDYKGNVVERKGSSILIR